MAEVMAEAAKVEDRKVERVSLMLDDELAKRVEKYRVQQYEKRGVIPSKNEVYVALVRLALDALDGGKVEEPNEIGD